MDNEKARTDSDELAGELLDGASAAGVDGEPADGRRWVDLLFLHALLERAHQPATSKQGDAIRQILDRLPDEPPRDADPANGPSAAPSDQTRAGRRSWLGWGASTFAAVAAAIVVYLVLGTQPTAQAALRQALDAADQANDREYAVKITLASGKEPSATLFVRGGNRFAVCYVGPLGREHWLGFDGTEAWLAPAAGPVFVSDKVERLKQRLQDAEIAMPFLQISTVLKRLQDDYAMTLVRGEGADPGGRLDLLHVRGRKKNDQRSRLPDEIEFWSRRHSGVVERMVLRWDDNGVSRVREVRFDLRGEKGLQDNWYGHAAHHEGLRRILRP